LALHQCACGNPSSRTVGLGQDIDLGFTLLTSGGGLGKGGINPAARQRGEERDNLNIARQKFLSTLHLSFGITSSGMSFSILI